MSGTYTVRFRRYAYLSEPGGGFFRGTYWRCTKDIELSFLPFVGLAIEVPVTTAEEEREAVLMLRVESVTWLPRESVFLAQGQDLPMWYVDDVNDEERAQMFDFVTNRLGWQVEESRDRFEVPEVQLPKEEAEWINEFYEPFRSEREGEVVKTSKGFF